MAVCLKENLLGQRIKMTVIIHHHSEIHLCPVAAFRAYVRRKARPAGVFPHANQLSYHFRSIRDCHRPTVFLKNTGKALVCIQ